MSFPAGSKSILVKRFLKFSSSGKCFCISVESTLDIIVSQNHFQFFKSRFPIISNSSLVYINSKARAVEWFSRTDQSLYQVASFVQLLIKNMLLNPGWSRSWIIADIKILNWSNSSKKHFSINLQVVIK